MISALKPRPAKLDDSVLVVDDRTDVLRAIARALRSRMLHVYAAATPDAAEEMLRSFAPRCLLCDYWLGDGLPLATALIPGWKRKYPCLERIALMTGTNSMSVAHCTDVDVVFHKPLDINHVVAFFADATPALAAPSSA